MLRFASLDFNLIVCNRSNRASMIPQVGRMSENALQMFGVCSIIRPENPS